VGTFLIERWLAGHDADPILDGASVAVVRDHVRSRGARAGLPVPEIEKLVIAASELGHNQLAHARGGQIAVVPIQRAGVPGVEVIAADRGDGIADPAGALRHKPPRVEPEASLGVGLSSVQELADEIDLDVRIGEGSCVWARKFAGEVPPRKQVGIYGRPFPGEPESGDDAAFARGEDALLLAVADGLGHGNLAREPSRRAVETALARRDASFDAVLLSCHDALSGTRGAVLTLARLHEADGRVEAACAGNVAAHLYGLDRTRRFTASSLVLGLRGRPPRCMIERTDLAPRDVLALFSDGLVSDADLEGQLELLREHPIVIAQRLVERFARGTDDVLVAVAR
jgi:anti-sigma regulatory factor (Ser/Thr protein kinase)